MYIISTPRNTIKKANLLPYISILVKKQRIKLGFSQLELSKKIGLGLKTLRKIEQGDLNVNFTKLNYLLNFFGMSLQPTELMTSPKRKNKTVFSQDYILKTLSYILPILKLKYNISELALFGSYAKEEASLESDIDILINMDSEISFEQEGEIQLMLENFFAGVKVDLTFKNNLHYIFAKEIEESKINVS